MSKFFPEEIRLRDIKTGDHLIKKGRPVDREYQPKNRAEKRFKDRTVDLVEKLDSNLPDYDTGYMWVELYTEDLNGNVLTGEYTIHHRLGRIPTRVALYFSVVEEPRLGKDVVHMQVPVIINDIGVTVCFTSKDKILLQTGTDAIWGDPVAAPPPNRGHLHEGHLRVMLWR